MRRNLLVVAAALTFGGAGLLAQENAVEMALDYSRSLKQNRVLMKEYSWKSRVEIEIEGEKKAAQIAHIRFNTDGELERTVVASESDVKKKRGIRGRIQRKKQQETRELVQTVAKLLMRYELPSTGTMVDFFERSGIDRAAAEGGPIRISGEKMIKSGDEVTIWIDAETQRPTELVVHTWVPKEEDSEDRVRVDSKTEYGTLGNGAAYPKKTTVKIPALEMHLEIEQFDHIKQGG